MRFHKTLTPLLLGALAAGCTDLDVTNPSQQTSDTFFRTGRDALAAVNATYHGLQQLGSFGRWQAFADDMRADIGTSRSPWTDLANFTKSVLSSYTFEVNRELWEHNYRTVAAANQVITNVPNVAMDTAQRSRYVAEAKFIRALSYYNLVTLFGGANGIPLLLEPAAVGQRDSSTATAAVYAQIEKDLTEAAAALPASYAGPDVGRATRGAANALLGKARLQQRKWADAATAFQAAVAGPYSLLPVYGDNFRDDRDNNAESIFEVQFTTNAQLAQGSAGYSGPKLYGPCGPAFCDGNPTRWYFEQFVAAGDTVRLNATIFYNRPATAGDPNLVFGQPFATRYAGRLNDLFIKKYTQYYNNRPDELFDNPTNFKVLRLGGVKLFLAEALNEAGSPAAALAPLNEVRARAKLAPVPAGLSQAAMRAAIEREQVLELGFEADRFRYLQRHNQLNPAVPQALDGLTLAQRDPDFTVFTTGRAEFLPIPNSETDLNPGVKQNTGY
jgi:hypothetical protein